MCIRDSLDKRVLEKIAVSLPRVVFGDDLLQLVPTLEECLRLGVRHLSTGHLGGVRLGRELGFIVHGEFGLNIANAGCLQAYEQLGLRDCLPPFTFSIIFENAGLLKVYPETLSSM